MVLITEADIHQQAGEKDHINEHVLILLIKGFKANVLDKIKNNMTLSPNIFKRQCFFYFKLLTLTPKNTILCDMMQITINSWKSHLKKQGGGQN